MLYSNTLYITVTLSLCNTKHKQYTFTLSLFGEFLERKLQKCVFWFLYTFPSARLHVTTGEMLNALLWIWIFLIFTVIPWLVSILFKIQWHQRTLRMKTACILLVSETNFLIFSETKALNQQSLQNVMSYFKLLHLCKFVLVPCLLKWTHAPEPLRCTYISLSTVNSKLEHVNSVHYIRASELFLWGNGLELLYTFIKLRVSFGTRLLLQSK